MKKGDGREEGERGTWEWLNGWKLGKGRESTGKGRRKRQGKRGDEMEEGGKKGTSLRKEEKGREEGKEMMERKREERIGR